MGGDAVTVVDVVTVRLAWAEGVDLRPVPSLLRGALGRRFADHPLVHQHDRDRVVYRYPLIQYRWDRGGPVLVGLGEGARFLARVDWLGMELDLGGRSVTVRDAV